MKDAGLEKGFFRGKRVLVMGLGRFGGGVDAVKFLDGAGAEVTVTDLASAEELNGPLGRLAGLGEIEFHFGGHREEDFREADVIVVNPAVPSGNRYVAIGRESGAVVSSQVELFFEYCPAEIIGITGANGKSTTAALTAALLRAGVGQEGFGYRKVWLSGNIGNEPMLTVLEEIGEEDLVVLELSSFQIEQLGRSGLGPAAGLLTNLSANHLDRYGTFEKYCAAKEGMFEGQIADEKRGCVSIFNIEDKVGRKWFEKYSRDAARECIGFSTDDLGEVFREAFSLPGQANLSNLAGAVAVCRYFGVDDERMLLVLGDFKGLAHRLELVCERGGVRWFNDSKSTTPESAIAGVESFGGPVILIAGGYDKGLDFEELGKVIAKGAKAAILIGDAARKISDSITAVPENKTTIQLAHSLEEAVEVANKMAASGDVVLLSPACASYGQFRNYEERGREFVKLVTRDS